MENTVLIDTGTRLKDLAETVIPCEIRKVVTWNTKKDKAVIHHKKVFKLAESIFAGANTHGDSYCKYCEVYACYGDKLGISIGTVNVEYTVGEILSMIKNSPYETLDGYMTQIHKAINECTWINLVEMEFVKSIYPELAADMENAREICKKRREAKEQAAREKRIANRKAEMEKDNADAMAIIDTAIRTIKEGGRVKNEDFSLWLDFDNCKHYTTFTYLLDKYGQTVPIKTRGFILNSLISVEVNLDGNMSYHYHGKKGSHGSAKLIDLLHELVATIRCETV